MSEKIVGAVLIAAFAVGVFLTYDDTQQAKENAIAQRKNLVAACERQNPLRQAVYDNTLIDSQTREAAASGFTGAEKKAVAHFAAKGYRTLDKLVDAASPVAVEEGSVVVDCEAAYPKPK